MERYWFELKGYEYITNWVSAYPVDEVDGSCHAYLIYHDQVSKKWVHFEVSDGGYRGLHEYNSLDEAIKGQSMHQIDNAKRSFQVEGDYGVEVCKFNKPKELSTYKEYIDNATMSENVYTI